MKYIINILLLIFLMHFGNAQNSNEIPVSELKGDSLNVYNILKKSIKLSATDSTNIHFLPVMTIFLKNDRICFETYFYDKGIRNSWNYATATYFGRLSFEKRHMIPEKEDLSEYVITEADVESEIIPSTFKFSVRSKNEVLIVEESKKPIVKSSDSYFIKAEFYRKTYKNMVDTSIYNFINEDSIDKSNYYFLCTKDYAMLKIKDKFGFISNTNEVIMPFNKNSITHYEQGFLVKEDSIHYFYDPIKKKKVSKTYDRIFLNKIRFYDESLLSIINGFHLVERDNSFNLLNYDNEEMLSKNYQSIDVLGPNKKNQYVLFVKTNDTRFDLIDLYTQDIIRSGEFMQLVGGQIIVKEKNKYGIINTDNDIMLENKYDEIIAQIKFINRVPVRLKEKWALYVTHKSEFVTEFKYSSIIVAGEFMIVSENDKYGVIDSDGKIKLPIEFDKIDFDSEKRIYTALKGETIDKYNRVLKKIK